MVYAPRLAPEVEPKTPLHEVRRPLRDESWVSRTAEEDFQFALSARRNLLVTGPDCRVAALLQRLATERTTIICCGSEPLRLPNPGSKQTGARQPGSGVSTIVLRDVDALTSSEQDVLAEWIASGDSAPHLITTASTSLLPLVDAGEFNATLYYRLNIVYIAMDAE